MTDFYSSAEGMTHWWKNVLFFQKCILECKLFGVERYINRCEN